MKPVNYGVVLTVAEEGPSQLDYCLKNLRSNIPPGTPVRVVSDGLDPPVYRALCEQHGAVYTPGEYLRRIECGGQWWERMLREGIATGAKWFLAIHPDTRFWRPLRAAPRFPVAGSLVNQGDLTETLSGGCVSFTAEAAGVIVESPLIRSPDLSELWLTCPDKEVIHLWYPLGYLSLDHQLSYVLRSLGIRFGHWAEVGSQPFVAPFNYDLRHAATHPHKLANCPPAGVSDDTPIRVITTCMSRLEHLKLTVPTWLAGPNVSVLVVDWSCPNGAAEWVQSLRDVRVAACVVPGKHRFNLASARNAGAFHAAQDLPRGHAELSQEIWAFMDADVLVDPAWAEEVRRTFQEGHYHVAGPHSRNMGGSVVLRPASYFAAGGYDETLQGWGCDDTLFYLMMRHFGVRGATWPGELASAIQHNDRARTRHYETKDKRVSNRVFDHYYRLKLEVMQRTGILPPPEECRKLLAEAESRHYPPGSLTFNGGLPRRKLRALPHIP